MTNFDAIDALLAAARQAVPLPGVEERRPLREGLNLSRAQVAQALGVSPSTVGGWESGRDPSGEVRERYAYFLEGARAKLEAREATLAVAEGADSTADSVQDEDGDADAAESWRADGGTEEVEALPQPQPCVLCGTPARHQVAGFPQHLDPAECGTTTPVPVPQPVRPTPAGPPAGTGRPKPVKVVPAGRRMQAASDTPDLIAAAVATALAEHEGDVDAATAALVRRAIPDAMALLDATRKGGRYDVVAHPWIPDILRKQSARGADQIWEARPKWARTELPPGAHEVTALDINGAYLSALKTHLPIGQLEHSTGFGHDRRRAGVHLITPPVWEHGAVLPNPSATATSRARCG